MQVPDSKSENVKVMVRCRPLLPSEQRPSSAHSGATQIKLNSDAKSVQIGERQFQFDAVFGPQDDKELVYMRSLRQLVEFAFQGYNCTVFLYGQTGTGKTYTHSSLTLAAFSHLFSLVQSSNADQRILIRASYYELYNEDIRDLLASDKKSSGSKLDLRESKARGVYVKNLSCYLVSNVAELERLKRLGDRQRATAATKMNEHSSRSHSIFAITVESVTDVGDQKARQGARGKQASASSSAVRLGRLNLIDLAGSERQAKSGSSGMQLREASRINLSLTCLALVIRALTDPASSHVPYRNSKLTRILSSSLGGDSKTLLIACISPAQTSVEESLSTLRFASRTKLIKNEATINEDPKDALLRKYRSQIEDLRSKLQLAAEQSKQLSEAETIEALAAAAAAGAANGSSIAPGGGTAGLPTGGGQQSDSSELVNQLRLLRAKIMVGGVNLLEKAELHERLLEASKLELEQKAKEEATLKRELELKRQNIELIAKSKGSLEEQLSVLDDKLGKVMQAYEQVRDEHRDLASEHDELKGGLLNSIRATSKEIKFADCIIEDFIPRHHLELLNNQAQYDEQCDEWQIKYVALSGNNAAHSARQMALARGDSLATTKKSNKGRANDCTHFAEPFIKLRDMIGQ